jgi:hypothetical protein
MYTSTTMPPVYMSQDIDMLESHSYTFRKKTTETKAQDHMQKNHQLYSFLVSLYGKNRFYGHE